MAYFVSDALLRAIEDIANASQNAQVTASAEGAVLRALAMAVRQMQDAGGSGSGDGDGTLGGYTAATLFSAMTLAGQKLSITVGDTTRNVVLPTDGGTGGGIGGSATLSELTLSTDGTEATGLFEASIRPSGEGAPGIHVEVAQNIDWENLSDYTFETYPPFSTNSTALCDNVNADLLDGLHANQLLQSVTLSGSDLTIKVGGTTKTVKLPTASSTSGVNTATTIVSTAPAGMAPIAVNSITLCDNLNADLLDGWHAANMFQRLSISGTTLTVQIAGVTKTVTLPVGSGSADTSLSSTVEATTFGLTPKTNKGASLGAGDRIWSFVWGDKIMASTSMSSPAYNNSSDMRMKEVVADVRLSVAQVADAPSFTFNWRDEAMVALGEQVGTSAQYWQGVMPQAVSEFETPEGETRLSLEYNKIAVAAAIANARAIRELCRRLGHEDIVNAVSFPDTSDADAQD